MSDYCRVYASNENDLGIWRLIKVGSTGRWQLTLNGSLFVDSFHFDRVAEMFNNVIRRC